MLEAQTLSRRIGERYLLRDVSVRVGAGQILGIVGPSGCGKTTLLRLLALIDSPDSGTVVFDGRTFSGSATGEDNVYPALSLVAQGYALWPHLTLRKMRAMIERVSDGHEHWETLGLETLMDRQPSQLSAGQRQRAALALALSVKPKVLLLDEVTSAQDVEHCDIIAKLLRAQAKSGMSIVLSTHLLQFVSGVADEFVFLDQGNLLEQGPIAQLREPKSERLRKFMFVA
jgi:polar amino acid transport system ATP-binding protein